MEARKLYAYIFRLERLYDNARECEAAQRKEDEK